MVGRFTAAQKQEKTIPAPPIATAMGALLNHITGGADESTFQPMNVNFGLFPELELTKRVKGRDRKKLYTDRAIPLFDDWLSTINAA